MGSPSGSRSAGDIPMRASAIVIQYRARGRRLMRNVALLLVLGTIAVSGCSAQGPAWVEVKGQRFEVEIAADDASRARGLMFRDSLEAGHGMLFIFEQEQPLAFWMKNTRIPLD